jgi:tRNA (adenine22-N1)-methyltransferase
MSERLDRITALIPDGKGAADIGTDHGCVPLQLLERGYPGAIFAADINEGPLIRARKNAAEVGKEDRIKFVLCDGLDKIAPDTVDVIAAAGMGGDTITGVLDRGYWCAAPGYTLVLQPMSHQNVLRYWLIKNEFEITHEELVFEGGNIYQIFTAVYGKAPGYSDAELFTGKYEQICEDPLFLPQILGLIKKFASALGGMDGGKVSGDGRMLLYRGVLQGLKEMEDRYENDYRG